MTVFVTRKISRMNSGDVGYNAEWIIYSQRQRRGEKRRNIEVTFMSIAVHTQLHSPSYVQ